MRWRILLFLLCVTISSEAQNTDSLTAADAVVRLNTSFYSPSSFYDFEEKTEKPILIIKPKFDYSLNSGTAISNGVSHVYEGGVSLGFELSTNNKKVDVDYFAGLFGLNRNMSNFSDSTGVLSGVGAVSKEGFGYFAQRIRGRLNWQFSKHFNAEIGNHTNFFGNGYRSMVLGDEMSPYPYLKLTTKVWKIKYTNLFMQLRNLENGISWRDARRKYVALHAIDFKVSENFSFTVFESVVWQSSDTLSTRDFELNYLNPIIFYRPVEFGQGSADNVLLGVAAKLRMDKTFMWYGQLFLDEFLLSQVKDGAGWWANKVGVQIGFQMANVIPGLWAYSEFNSARPFTYTHGSVLQNYGHRNQSLAHPLGTNFYEWTSGAQFQKKNWVFTGRFNWALYGRDKDGNNYGGDIFRSYRSPYNTFGNRIGQGNTHHSYITQLTASRLISSKMKMYFFGNYSWRHVKNEFGLQDEHSFSIGISSRPFKINTRNSSEIRPYMSNDF